MQTRFKCADGCEDKELMGDTGCEDKELMGDTGCEDKELMGDTGCEDKELMGDTGCEDKKLMGGLAFPVPFQGLKKPWADGQLDTKIYTSDYVKTGFDNMFDLTVPGLGETTIKDVLDHLVEQECLSFPFGGSVRDQLLGKVPGDLDMDSSCDAGKLFEICIKKWVCEEKKPAMVCSINGHKTVMHIGTDEEVRETEELDAANWDNNFYGDGTGLEYTTNSIGYFTNPATGQIIIDITGSGVDDTCDKKIGLPVVQDHWGDWFENAKNGYYVVYRAWKLRAKGFDFKTEEIKQFLVTKAKAGFDDRPGKLKKFYCTIVLKGEYNYGVGCTVALGDCPAALESKQKYDDLFKADLTAEYWNAHADPLINNFDNDCQ